MTGYGSGAYGSGPYGGDTTPGGLPTVHVLLDDGTGTFPYDLTNMSGVSYVLLPEGFKHDHGRQDWQGGVTAGSLSLTLNNADGRFTPGSTIIASPSPIKVDQRIRITETVNGTTFTRFTGYVKQWPVAWPATVTTWATVQVMATDAQARAERVVLGPSFLEWVASSTGGGAYALFPLADGVLGTATANNTANYALTVADTAGPAPTFTGTIGPLQAVQFNDPSDYLMDTKNVLASGAGGTDAISWVMQVDHPPSLALYIITGVVGSTGSFIGVQATTGFIGEVTTATYSTVNVADGSPHVVAWEYAAGKLYVDGVLVLTGLPTFIGGAISTIGVVSGTGATLQMAALHAGFASNVAATYAAWQGWPGETSTSRITRLAGQYGLSLGTLDTSLTNLPAANIGGGETLGDTLRSIAEAEMGVVYINGNGALDFHNRNRNAAKTAPDLILPSSYVAPDAQPVDDDQQIVNYLEVTAEGAGDGSQVVRNTTSEAAHGRYSNSVSYPVQTVQEALDRANWTIANFAEPTTRYGTLTVNLYAMPVATQALVLDALEIDSWIQITDMPTQNTGGATVDLVVEGYSEQVTASSWTVTLNVVSKALTDVFILDDPVRGVLDAGNRLYV